MAKKQSERRPFKHIITDTGPAIEFEQTIEGKRIANIYTGEPMRRGRARPTETEWQGALRYVIALVNNQGLPTGRGAKTKIRRWMEERFGERDCYPSETELKRHARLIYEANEELEKDGK
jgi:hypothetical protein